MQICLETAEDKEALYRERRCKMNKPEKNRAIIARHEKEVARTA